MRLEGFEDVSALLRCGVYALCAKGVVIYVGKSKSLYSRIYTHRNLSRRGQRGQSIPSWLPVKGFTFDEVFIRPCRLEEIDALELAMINLYKPRYNESLKTHAPIRAPISLTIAGAIITLNAEKPKFERRV